MSDAGIVHDSYVPVRLAMEGTRRPDQTIRRWIREGIVRHIRDEHGRILIHGGDLLEAHTTRGSRQHARLTEVA